MIVGSGTTLQTAGTGDTRFLAGIWFALRAKAYGIWSKTNVQGYKRKF